MTKPKELLLAMEIMKGLADQLKEAQSVIEVLKKQNQDLININNRQRKIFDRLLKQSTEFSLN